MSSYLDRYTKGSSLAFAIRACGEHESRQRRWRKMVTEAAMHPATSAEKCAALLDVAASIGAEIEEKHLLNLKRSSNQFFVGAKRHVFRVRQPSALGDVYTWMAVDHAREFHAVINERLGNIIAAHGPEVLLSPQAEQLRRDPHVKKLLDAVELPEPEKPQVPDFQRHFFRI